VFDHGNYLVGVEVGMLLGGGEAQECCSRAFFIALSYMPPRAFWGEEDPDRYWYWPYPLNSEWNSVCPLIGTLDAASIDSSCDELAHYPAPAHVNLVSFDPGSEGTHMFTKVVRYGLSTTGATSEAY
jgi:hypothetical protein